MAFRALLKKSRMGRGVDEQSAAAMFGLNVSAYCDLEVHDDEWTTVVPAGTVVNIVNFFGVNWRDCADWQAGSIHEVDSDLSVFCRSVRERSSLSRVEFADRFGFYPAFCEVVEGHPKGLSLWPIEVAVKMATEFDVDALALTCALLAPPQPE